MIYILINSYDEIKKEILQTAVMWCKILLPSLFPYLVLSQYLTSSGIMNSLSHTVGIVLKRIIKTDSLGMNVFLCSLLCGYPSGAVCTADLYRNSFISKSCAQRLICFTNNAGPLFLISAVGTGMLKNTSDGIALYVIQTLSCICYAFFSGKNTPDEKIQNADAVQCKDFCECVRTSVITIINIGGFIITVSVICRTLIIGFNALTGETSYECMRIFETVIYSIFELSKASELIAQLPHTFLSFSVLCAAVSWGGVSVFMQVKSSLPKEISLRNFVFAKFIQSAISFVLGYVYKTKLNITFAFVRGYNLLLFSLMLGTAFFIVFIFSHTQRKRL